MMSPSTTQRWRRLQKARETQTRQADTNVVSAPLSWFDGKYHENIRGFPLRILYPRRLQQSFDVHKIVL